MTDDVPSREQVRRAHDRFERLIENIQSALHNMDKRLAVEVERTDNHIEVCKERSEEEVRHRKHLDRENQDRKDADLRLHQRIDEVSRELHLRIDGSATKNEHQELKSDLTNKASKVEFRDLKGALGKVAFALMGLILASGILQQVFFGNPGGKLGRIPAAYVPISSIR